MDEEAGEGNRQQEGQKEGIEKGKKGGKSMTDPLVKPLYDFSLIFNFKLTNYSL